MKSKILHVISLIIILALFASLVVPIYARTPLYVGRETIAAYSPTCVYVSGNYAYVTTGSYVYEVDITDKTNPTMTRSIAATPANDLTNPTSIFVVGNYAYVTAYGDNELTIIDLSGVAMAIEWAVLDIPLEGAKNVFVSGNYAYVASSTYDGLAIVDVTDPTDHVATKVIGSISGIGFPYYLDQAYDVVVSGSYAYVTSYADKSLVVINVSNPALPTIAGYLTGFSGPRGLSVSGNYAYITDFDALALKVVDISNPAAPELKGTISGLGSPNYLGTAMDVALYGNYAVVAVPLFDKSLTLVDISTPASPTFSGHIAGYGAPNYLDNPISVFVSGDYAYVCTNASTDIVNIYQLSLRSPSIVTVNATDYSTSTAKLNANITSDGGEDTDDTQVRYGYGTTSLYNVGTLADNTTSTATGIATGAPIGLSGGFTESTYRTTTITVTGAGTFGITLPVGITGTAINGAPGEVVLVGGPVIALPAGVTTTVDTGVTTGRFFVVINNTYDTVTPWETGWSVGDNPQLAIAGLTDSTTYYFRAQVKNTVYTSSAANQLSFTTYAIPDNVTYFTGNPLTTTLKIAWAMPDGASAVLVRYDTDTYPITIADGYLAYSGSSSSTEFPTTTALTPGTTYYLSIWGVDNVTYSTGYKTLALTTLGASFTAITGGDTLPTPTMPSNWNGPIDPAVLSNFEPFYSIVTSFASSWGMPPETMWLIMVLVVIAFVGLLVLLETQKLMAAIFVVGIGMLAASMMHILPTYFIAIALLCFLGAWRIETSTG